MIILRRAEERRHDRRGKEEVWLTFHPLNREDPLADGFEALEILREDRLSPGAKISRQLEHEAQVLTYVREGALAYEDSLGRSGVIQTDEFQRMTAGRGIRYTETNPSQTDWVQVFHFWLRPAGPSLETSYEQKRFGLAERRGGLFVVASPDSRKGSLRIFQDVLVYSAVLIAGQHVVYELSAGRSAWLQLVSGEASFGNSVLTSGDGVGVKDERAVSFTAREQTEILLLDLGQKAADA